MQEKNEVRNVQEAAKHMVQVLKALGVDLKDPNFENTPARFVKYLNTFMQPFDPKEILETNFPVHDGFHNMVVQSNIPFRAICAHHLVPVLGRAHVGYIPREHVVGLSKLTRLVRAVAQKTPSLQESVCEEIADHLQEQLQPSGAIVIIQAEHGCMACRGVAEAGIITSTSSVRGVFRDVPHAREEFFNLIASRRNL